MDKTGSTPTSPGMAKIDSLLLQANELHRRDTLQARELAAKAHELVSAALWRHNLDSTTVDKTRLDKSVPEARELLRCCAEILLSLASCDIVYGRWMAAREQAEQAAYLFQLLDSPVREADARLVIAEALSRSGEHDASDKQFSRCLEIYHARNEAGKAAYTLAGLACLRIMQSRYAEARDLNREAAELEAENYPEARIFVAMNNSTLGYSLGNYDEGVRAVEAVIPFCRKAHDFVSLTGLLNRAGINLSEKGNNREALEYHEEALQLSRRLGSRMREAMSLQCKGLALINIGRYEEALDIFTELTPIFAELGMAEEEARCYNNIANAQHTLGQYGRSLHSARHSLELHTALDIKRGTAIAHAHIANASMQLGRFDQSLRHNFASLQIHRSLGSRGLEAVTLSHIAQLYLNMNEYKKVAEYSQRAFAIAREITDRKLEAWCRLSLGRCSEQDKNYTEAEEHYNAGLQIAVDSGDVRAQASCYTSLGRLRYALASWCAALDYFQKGLQLEEQMKDTAQMASSFILISRACRKLGRYDDALDALQQALGRAGANSFDLAMTDIHKEMSAVYEEQGKLTEALHHFKEYNRYHLEQFTAESRERLHNLQVAEELEQARRNADLEKTRHEAVQRELELQQRELTSVTLTAARSSEALLNVYQQVKALRSRVAPDVTPELGAILHSLEQSLDSRQDWEAFEQRFTKIHSGFFAALRNRCPELSPVETKVCSLLRLNLNIKEMANLLGVGANTIKKHRYNIRRKLGLRQGENLTGTLSGF